MQKIDGSGFIDIVLTGAIRAFDDYYQMSDGDWVQDTPESWYSCAIAQFLSLSHYTIGLEASAREVRKSANRGKMGRPKRKYRANGRADICVWDIDERDEFYPDGLIEIKRAWGWDKKIFEKDLDRLATSILSTGKATGSGTISFGLFVVMTDAKAETRKEAKNVLREMFRRFNVSFDDYNKDHTNLFCYSALRLGQYYKDDESMPAAMGFMLEANELT